MYFVSLFNFILLLSFPFSESVFCESAAVHQSTSNRSRCSNNSDFFFYIYSVSFYSNRERNKKFNCQSTFMPQAVHITIFPIKKKKAKYEENYIEIISFRDQKWTKLFFFFFLRNIDWVEYVYFSLFFSICGSFNNFECPFWAGVIQYGHGKLQLLTYSDMENDILA